MKEWSGGGLEIGNESAWSYRMGLEASQTRADMMT